MFRWRAMLAFSLAVVMGTTSVGVCALFCDFSRPALAAAHAAEAPATVSTCHQSAPAAEPLSGPGYGQPASHCPVLAAFSAEGRSALVPAAGQAHSFAFGSWPAALPASALEVPAPRLRASARLELSRPQSSLLPLYLERGVLRI